MQTLVTSYVHDPLVAAYFGCYNKSYPVLHEGMFRAQCASRNRYLRNSSWYMVYHMVLVIGECVGGFTNQQYSTYYDAARSRFGPETLERGNLTTVEALLLISNYLQQRDRLKPYGIRTNTVSPGYMDTILNEGDDIAASRNQWAGRNTTGRLGAPSELTRAAVLLASPAGSYINGADISRPGLRARYYSVHDRRTLALRFEQRRPEEAQGRSVDRKGQNPR